jgi:hypothetical protein
LVRILLAAGADPTAQDAPHCRTALHTAAMINDAELVKVKVIWRLHFFYAFLLFRCPYQNMTCFFFVVSYDRLFWKLELM